MTVLPTSVAPIVAPIAVRTPIADPDAQAPFQNELVATPSALWIEQASSLVRLLRVDLATGEIRRTILPYEVELMAAPDGTVWALGPYGYVPGPKSFTLSRVNPDTGELTTAMSLPTWQVVVTGDSVWSSEANPVAGTTSAGVTTASGVLARTPVMQLVERDLSGRVLRRLDLELYDLEVACGDVWGDNLDDQRPLLREVDPATGSVAVFGGTGPVFDRSGTCWRWQGLRLEELSPARAYPAHEYQLSQPIFDGANFWDGPSLYLQDVHNNHGGLLLQERDPATAAPIGPSYTIDPAHLPMDKNGIEARLIAAGGWLWLVNPSEVIRFDIASR
jgi:hypothetical protein